jgi:hypothetical protein
MALVTPLTSLPASGSTPAGTLSLSNIRGRLTAALTGGGAATLNLIKRFEGGAWGYVDGGELIVGSTTADIDDGVGALDFDNDAAPTLYHVILRSGSSSCLVYLSSLVDPATSTALVAHASSHLAGGGDDLLSSPGTLGGVTPGVFCGTFGPDSGHQNSIPSVNGDTFVLRTAAQTLTTKTLTAPVINGLTSASGNADFSGSTGTFKTSTGAVTIGGGAAAIGITSSAAAITVTAGAASTWSSAAGALTLSGFSGINLQVAGTTVADVGATSASAVTLAANKSFVGAAGSGAVTFGSMTGDMTMPTGSVSWAGAANKNFSLSTSGTGTITIDNASTWSIGATNGTTGTIGRSGQTLNLPGVINMTGTVSVPTVASGAVTGGVPLVFPLTVSSGANGDQDITVTPKIRVIKAWLVMKGAGTAGSTVTVKNGATAITEVLDVSAKLDKAVVDFTSIDDAQMDIAAAGTLRISHASTGADFPGAELYVQALHVA